MNFTKEDNTYYFIHWYSCFF